MKHCRKEANLERDVTIPAGALKSGVFFLIQNERESQIFLPVITESNAELLMFLVLMLLVLIG